MYHFFVNLKQAYDKVWRKGLLLKMQNAGFHAKLYKWLTFFLIHRTIQTRVNDGISSKEILEEGLPCTLFLLFINLEKALYADDLVLWHTSKHSNVSRSRINEDLILLGKYCDKWKLNINYTKTVYSVFILSSKVAKQKQTIKILGHQLKKDQHPIYLGSQIGHKTHLKRPTERY